MTEADPTGSSSQRTSDAVPTTDRGRRHPGTVREVFGAFAVRGLTSFGGPIAHLGYFREAFVVRRRWLSETDYADLVALCQFLPGPASSQVGMALGLIRAGYRGMLAAWLAFTLPSAIALVAFAYGLRTLGIDTDAGWIRGLKAAAVAVVGYAVLSMARSLTPDRRRATIGATAMIIVLFLPAAWAQIGAIATAGLIGLLWLRESAQDGGGENSGGQSGGQSGGRIAEATPDTGAPAPLRIPVGRRVAVGCLAVFGALLIGLPVLAAAGHSRVLTLVDGIYRSGALVFGGGHVVLPLLQKSVVATGLVDHNAFLAGYGAAQAVPGPLFTFAAFIGTVADVTPHGVLGAAIALLAIFVPAALLLLAALPFWDRLRHATRTRRVLMGVNAGVVGILAAALYNPVFTQGITSPRALIIAVAAFIALSAWKAPAWAVVIAAGIVGAVIL